MSSAIASAASAASTSSTASPTAPNALTSLSNNFNSFLNLLLTQLKNQDPASPMDSNTFTTELVQFSGVEQQITTNNSLTQLIQATQGTEVIQATSVVGKQVTLNSTQIPLQNSTGGIDFTTASAEPIAIKITNGSGVDVCDASLTSKAGANTWTWNGLDNNGSQQPDGAYTVSVTGQPQGGAAAAVQNNNGTVTLQAGAVSVGFSNVESVGGN